MKEYLLIVIIFIMLCFKSNYKCRIIEIKVKVIGYMNGCKYWCIWLVSFISMEILFLF